MITRALLLPLCVSVSATRQLADKRTGTAEVVAESIGRALGKVPNRPPTRADYHAWTPGGALLAAVSPRGNWLAVVAADQSSP